MDIVYIYFGLAFILASQQVMSNAHELWMFFLAPIFLFIGALLIWAALNKIVEAATRKII